MLSTLILAVLIQSDGTVVLLTDKISAGELVAEISRQTGDTIVLDPDLHDQQLAVYLFNKDLSAVLNALSEILDLNQVKSPGRVRLEKKRDVWSWREGLERELEEEAENALRSAYRIWRSLPLTGEESNDTHILEKWVVDSIKDRPDLDDAKEYGRYIAVRSAVYKPGYWPMPYACSQLSAREFEEFLKGSPVLASTERISGVALITKRVSPNGVRSKMSWVFFNDPRTLRLRKILHSRDREGDYTPYSDHENIIYYHQIESRPEEYPKHLIRQGQEFESVNLMAFEMDPEVKGAMEGDSPRELWHGMSRKEVSLMALWTEQHSYSTTPDLAVEVDDIVVIKSKYHWRRRTVAPKHTTAMPVSLFTDPVKLLTRASEYVLDGTWSSFIVRYDSGFNGPPGDYHTAGTAFAKLWVSLTPSQIASATSGGLRYSSLNSEQRKLFSDSAYRSFNWSHREELQMLLVNPQTMPTAKLVMKYEPVVYQYSNAVIGGGGGSGCSLKQAMKQGLFDNRRNASDLYTLSVGYDYTISVVVGGQVVIENDAQVFLELSRGSYADHIVAFERFVAEYVGG